MVTVERDRSGLELLQRINDKGLAEEYRNDEGVLVRLWDRLEESWTMPLDADIAQRAYLRQISLACSACGFTDGIDGQVEKHIEQTQQMVAEHRGAELVSVTQGDQFGTACSACSAKFMARRLQGTKHLERFSQQVGEAHQEAREIRFKRYSLEPVGSVTGLTLGQDTVPVDIQEERRPQPVPGRGRRRGRRGGRRRR